MNNIKCSIFNEQFFLPQIPRSRSTLSSDKGHLFCHRLRRFSQIFGTDFF